MKVPVDVEPILEDQITSLSNSYNSDYDWSAGRRISEDSLGLSLPPSRRTSRQIPIREEEPTDSKFVFSIPDDVVSEDGEGIASVYTPRGESRTSHQPDFSL